MRAKLTTIRVDKVLHAEDDERVDPIKRHMRAEAGQVLMDDIEQSGSGYVVCDWRTETLPQLGRDAQIVLHLTVEITR